MVNRHKKQQIRSIETHLRHYRMYKSGIRNLQKQLDYIMPSMTANYEMREGSSGTFVISSTTEKYAIDRIESKRALDLHEQIRRFQLIVDSIDDAVGELAEMEQQFVRYRYFDGCSVKKTAELMGYSEKNIFVIRNQTMDKLLISLAGVLDFY
ncbi:sigma-70 RNA polymerase sigma factor region 4 domain-containing protein [Effusibacillus pohliae]|uniref:sigma-70 family RNA polymerase sigma factor n=1 Tax=Effusibacillus pohliae TaxID=232270 RepID=UPI0003648720|nr:sigma-70 family RNA polymerase sigma factor [Effusibacillus pohliae]